MSCRLRSPANCDDIFDSLQNVYTDAGTLVKRALKDLQNLPNGVTGVRTSDSEFKVANDRDGPFLDSKVMGSDQNYVIDLGVGEKSKFLSSGGD